MKQKVVHWPRVPNMSGAFRARWRNQEIAKASRRQAIRENALKLKAACDEIVAVGLDGRPRNAAYVEWAADRAKCIYSKRARRW